MKYILLVGFASSLIISVSAFIVKGFSQDTTIKKKSDSSQIVTIQEVLKERRKVRSLDDSVSHYKERDSVALEERKDITKANKAIGDKLKIINRKADANLKATILQVQKMPAMYFTIPKPREVQLFKQPTIEPLTDTIVGERTFWDRLFFRKKHRR